MKIHCIGIGGIGVSSLAQYYLAQGHEVSGSDLALSEVTEFLKKKGVTVFSAQEAGNITSAIDLVIHSPAVPAANPELKAAAKLGIATLSYPEALGKLTEDHYTIAISGSHGKSTTTAMTALALIAGGVDPTVIVGTKLKEFGNSNFRKGKSDVLVIEACEYDGSFLSYEPDIAVVTNVDKEHLDYFKTFANVIKTFKDFAKRLPKDGVLVANSDDAGVGRLKLETAKRLFKLKKYSLRQKDVATLARRLKVPGKHNVSNALAALQVARLMGVKDSVAFAALSKFQGTWRRFETKKTKIGKKSITIISDYGHHPNEIKATLQAAREKYPKKKIWLLFQPHQYQRTHYLFNDFVKVFTGASVDEIIITDIYDVAGRETGAISASVSAEKLAQKIKKPHVRYMPLPEGEDFIKKNIRSGEVLVVMGAGSIYKVAEKL